VKLRFDKDGSVAFFCPACKTAHSINVGVTQRPRWSYNGNAEAPTFMPSVKVRGIRQDLTEEQEAQYVKDYPGAGTRDAALSDRRYGFCCHLWVRDGLADFCSDSTHALAGKLGVPLPDFPHQDSP